MSETSTANEKKDDYSRDLREQNLMIEEIEKALFIAQEANRAKSDFLSRMSHEMLTPMNTIQGMLQVAMAIGIPENIKYYFEEIDYSSQHLLQLIKDLLDLSGTNDRTIKLNESGFSFGSVVSHALDRLNREIINKKHSLTCNIDPSVPELLIGDEKRLSQVIVHLLSNSIKFTPENGKINLSANVDSEEDGEITLKVEIADNGIGIAEEHKCHIFNVFEQVDGSMSRKYDGTGIGLPMVKRIIEMMGGKIWVESEFGKGAKFIFTCKVRSRWAEVIQENKKTQDLGFLW
jgi:signal transduction histidine kinase